MEPELHGILKDMKMDLDAIKAKLVVQSHKIDLLMDGVNKLLSTTGEHLVLTFQGDELMKVKMAPKSSKKPAAVMPPVKWSTLTGGVGFQLVDASGAPISPPPDPAAVTTTLVGTDASGVTPSALVTITPGQDSLSYKIGKAPGVTGSVTLDATLSYVAGTPGPFSASLTLELDTPGAADLMIIFAAAP